MANPSAVTTLVLSGAGGSRTWTATAATQDTAAGGSVVVTIATSSTGTTPPTAETSYNLTVYIDNTATSVRLLSTVDGGTATLYFTADGTAATAARAGLLRMVIAVANTGGLASNNYNGNSDTGGTGSTGFTFTTTNSGYIRATTTAVTTLNQTTYAYGNTITGTTVLGAVPYKSETVSMAFGPLAAAASAASTTATFTSTQGATDNRFPASSNTDATVTSAPNAALVATPWTVLTTVTEASATVDPRLSFTHLLQSNDNTYGTPPESKNKTSGQRLTSDLDFISSRVVNAAGVGVNGITWTRTFQDHGHLAAAQSNTPTSANEGGEDGWANTFLVWSASLPGGQWDKSCVITAPSNATGLDMSNTTSYSLVASNPNYKMIVGAGPATTATDARHFFPGTPLLIGMVVFDTLHGTTLPIDAGTPAIAIGRFNLTYGRAEYLSADGVTWAGATGGTVYYFPATVSPGDPNAYTVSITNTTSFSDADLFAVGRANVGGVPVSAFQKEIVVNGINNHDRYAFDPGGFIGYPTR